MILFKNDFIIFKYKMLLKSSSRNPSPIGINLKRIISKTPTNPRSQSPSLKKKFTPTVNKSFTCYKEKSLSKHQRTTSFDKNRDSSTLIRRSKFRSLKLTGKIIDSSKEQTLETAKTEMANENYSKALDILNQLHKQDVLNLELIYSRGVCNMHLKQYKMAIEDFISVADGDPVFDKQLYIALYMCFLSSNQPLMALRYLSRGIRKFPNFSQGYMLRGQLLNKLKKYEKAMKDFQKTISIDKQHHPALLYMAESFIGLKDYESALKVLSIAITKPEIIRKALMIKSKVEYEIEHYDNALCDLEKILDHWPEETMAYYYKAKINFEMKNFSEAALCFEQVIKGIEDPEIINSAVCYIGKIKIKERDFYDALHTFERGIKNCITPEQKILHLYTEGVICLMKRKLEEGVNIFTNLLKSNDPILKEFQGNCYENLGFAYFALSKYDKASNMLTQAKKYITVDKSSEFNHILSDAILASSHKSGSKALKMFKSSRLLFPKNPMPEICRACMLMHHSFKSEEFLHMLIKAELLIDNIFKSRDPESEILFYRSILKLCLKNYDSAFENAKKAIEKADENLTKNYIQRGYCNALLKKYDEAVQDFTIALQLNEDLKEIYIFRGISAYLQDDLQLAFDDFIIASKKYQNDTQLQLKIAKLLCIIGSYNDSLSVLDDNFPQNHNCDIEIIRARNYIFLLNFEKALEKIKLIPKSDPKYKSSEADREILEFIMELKSDNTKVLNCIKFCNKLKENFGSIFNKKYLYWFIGILLFYSKDYVSASSYFQGVLEVLHNEEPDVFADSITIEEENCEILYNLALCSLCGGNDDINTHALMIFEELSEVLNTKHRGQLLFLSAIIELSQNNKVKAEKFLKDAQKCDSETIAPFFNNEPTTILPLHTSNEFASMFPLVPISIENLPIVYIRPSIVLPRIELEISLSSVIEQVISLYTITTVTPRPEAPWLIRNNGSIQFTDNIIEVTHDITDTEKSTHNEKDEEESFHKDIEPDSKSQLKRIAKSQSIIRKKTFNSEESENKDSNEDEEETKGFFEQKIKYFCKE